VLQVVPWGLRKELNWIAREYNNPPVFITENGFSDLGGLNDTDRVLYYTVSNRKGKVVPVL
jgi:beta-glucosidase/6-phospho-beta-glucosidase/beta-galactosidase